MKNPQTFAPNALFSKPLHLASQDANFGSGYHLNSVV